MATETKGAAPTSPPPRGVRIFTYPKTIFLWPTFVAAVVAAIIMIVAGNKTLDPTKNAAGGPVVEVKSTTKTDAGTGTETKQTDVKPVRRFTSPQNLAGLLFTTVFFVNLIIMSIDFPRFTIIALILGVAALLFLGLYINVFYNILPPLVNLLEHLFTVANAQFYLVIATAILITMGIIWVTRYLDYWVILPNEILHNHGPFSDLERFSTTNLKFDKEIPDILEFALLGSGRLVLHIQGNPRSYVLDNVLWIDSKEAALKRIMGRVDVHITTDQEAGGGLA